MTTYPVCRSTLIAIVLLFTPFGRASETSCKSIVEERESVLSQILAEHEKRHASGISDEKIVMAARLALYSFRRDAATAPLEKTGHQEMIVRLFEKELEQVNVRAKAGLTDNIAILEARARLLAARQLLEEIRLKSSEG